MTNDGSTSTMLTAGDFRVHCVEDAGAGPPLALVHSSGLSSRQWSALRRAFAGAHRVLTVDLIGYGRSDPWTRALPFTLDLDLNAVLAVLEHAGEPVVLVGHSYGGLLALKAALARPERVAALVVHEPVAWGVVYSAGDDALVGRVESISDSGLFTDALRGGTDPWYEQFIDFWGGPGAWQALPEPQRQAFLSVGPKVFDEVSRLGADRTPHDAYRAIVAPTVLTYGEETVDIERRVCEIIAGAVDGAELRRISGGHMAPITHPPAFHEAVRDAALRAVGPAPFVRE